jgi:hypothetical protein
MKAERRTGSFVPTLKEVSYLLVLLYHRFNTFDGTMQLTTGIYQSSLGQIIFRQIYVHQKIY